MLVSFDLTEKSIVAGSSHKLVQAGKRTNTGGVQENLNFPDKLSTQFAHTHNDSEQELSIKNTIRTPVIPNNQVSVCCPFSNENLLNELRLGVGVPYIDSTNEEQYYPEYKLVHMV